MRNRPPHRHGKSRGFTGLSSGFPSSVRARRRRPVLVETLEERVVLSTIVDPIGSFGPGTITIAGTPNDDTFTLAASGSDLVATVDGATTIYQGALSGTTSVNQIEVDGGAGNDTLNVDVTGGLIHGPTIAFDGGAGFDELAVVGTPPSPVLSTSYSGGQAPGSGSLTYADDSGQMTINFVNLEPVIDTVPGPLTVTGTNGNDAITYQAPANPADQGLVSVNNQETIEFANKTSLTINTQNGTDAVSINHTTAQTGLAGITVNGGDPSAGDTLTVSGTPGNDTVNYSPTGPGAGTVAVATLPTVTFSGIGAVAYNGAGGNDALTVTTPVTSAATDITFTPGATVNQGSVSLRQGSNAGAGATLLPPLSYTNIDRDGSLTFATADGTRHDTLTYNGIDGGDTFTIGGNVTDDQVQLATPGNFAGALDVTASGVSALVVQGVGSNDAFVVTAAPSPSASPRSSTAA